MSEGLTRDYAVAVRVEDDWAVDGAVLRRAALATLVHQGAEPAEVAVVVSDDSALRALNSRYRGIDAPTDVLAFPHEESGPCLVGGERLSYLGDVVVSFSRAQEQAGEAGHSTLAELQLLVVHGVLHLLGHDDQTEEGRTAMWAAQEAILSALGVEVCLPE